MAEVLDYRSASKRPPPKDPTWTAKRVAYYVALLGWFSLIAFWAGPNVWLFGRVTGMRESDLHEQVNRLYVPLVRAMLEYQKDFGALPPNTRTATKPYFGENVLLTGGSGYVQNGVLIARDYKWHHTIRYNFNDTRSPWSAQGGYYNGPIWRPPVNFETPFAPTTRPTRRGLDPLRP